MGLEGANPQSRRVFVVFSVVLDVPIAQGLWQGGVEEGQKAPAAFRAPGVVGPCAPVHARRLPKRRQTVRQFSERFKCGRLWQRAGILQVTPGESGQFYPAEKRTFLLYIDRIRLVSQVFQGYPEV